MQAMLDQALMPDQRRLLIATPGAIGAAVGLLAAGGFGPAGCRCTRSHQPRRLRKEESRQEHDQCRWGCEQSNQHAAPNLARGPFP